MPTDSLVRLAVKYAKRRIVLHCMHVVGACTACVMRCQTWEQMLTYNISSSPTHKHLKWLLTTATGPGTMVLWLSDWLVTPFQFDWQRPCDARHLYFSFLSDQPISTALQGEAAQSTYWPSLGPPLLLLLNNTWLQVWFSVFLSTLHPLDLQYLETSVIAFYTTPCKTTMSGGSLTSKGN